jgi:hypothetical protein
MGYESQYANYSRKGNPGVERIAGSAVPLRSKYGKLKSEKVSMQNTGQLKSRLL